jgi:hypothetical protein
VRAPTPTSPEATSYRRRRPAWYISIRLFTLERMPWAGGRQKGLSDKQSRVIPVSRRTRVLYSQLIILERLEEVIAR